ncbi:MAG: hypothetical protein QMA93_03715, partial [Acidimicrobiales bacterium]
VLVIAPSSVDGTVTGAVVGISPTTVGPSVLTAPSPLFASFALLPPHDAVINTNSVATASAFAVDRRIRMSLVCL